VIKTGDSNHTTAHVASPRATALDAEPGASGSCYRRAPFGLTSLHHPAPIHSRATPSGTSATSPGRYTRPAWHT
jgi:hypothetical protein